MCGLIGYSGPKDNNFNLDKIKLLLMLNQERGKDSLGYYTPEIGIIKEIGKAEEHLSKKDFKIPENNLFIGHVRAGTVGANTKNNAHPFNYGNIVLAMNGTLSNHWELCRQNNLSLQDFDVDSQVLTAIINKQQSKDVLSKILGGCALIYTDTNTGKLYCYRNIDRPLYRGVLNGGIYISSLDIPLKVIGCSDVKEFKQDRLYEILDGAILNTIKIKRAVPEVIKHINTEIDKENNGIFLNVNFSNMKGSEFIGKFLTPKRSQYGIARNIEHYALSVGYSYEVIESTDVQERERDYIITIINNMNEPIMVSKFIFEEKFPILSIGDYVFSTISISYKNPKDGIFCYSEDLLIIVNIDKEGNFECRNTVSGKIATSIKGKYIRFAYPLEVMDFKNQWYSLLRDDTDTTNTEDVPFEEVIESKKLTEVQIYEHQVKNTTFTTFENLSQFTFDSISDLVSDLKEVDLNKEVSMKINKIDILLDNYTEKVVTSNLI